MTRLEALKEAEAVVERLYPRTNARGYAESILSPERRLAEIRRTAAFLLGEEVTE